jgi:hypothetical protein
MTDHKTFVRADDLSGPITHRLEFTSPLQPKHGSAPTYHGGLICIGVTQGLWYSSFYLHKAGADPGFQVSALKKIGPSGGRHENIWGVPPPWIRPCKGCGTVVVNTYARTTVFLEVICVIFLIFCVDCQHWLCIFFL